MNYGMIVHSKIAVIFFFNAIPVGTFRGGICRNGREIDLDRQLDPEANHALPRGMLAPIAHFCLLLKIILLDYIGCTPLYCFMVIRTHISYISACGYRLIRLHFLALPTLRTNQIETAPRKNE